jgi:hypothetical protein
MIIWDIPVKVSSPGEGAIRERPEGSQVLDGFSRKVVPPYV